MDKKELKQITTKVYETVNEENGYTTITYEYVYDGYKFFLEAEVNAVQTHNAADAIKSAWGVDVNVSLSVKDVSENVSEEDRKIILEKYLETYDHSDDQSTWFGKIRAIGEELGYAPQPKLYKKNPESYKGHVGDVSGVIRVAITGRTNSPDVWCIQQVLGEKRTTERIKNAIK